MTDAELLSKVKSGLLITGDFQDEALQIYIDEVKNYLKSAGVSDEVINSSASVGIIVRGTADLFNLGNGGTNLSEYFMQRAIQLAMNCENSTITETTCAGHTILCENGIVQPQAQYLQFMNSTVTTDIEADKTIVTPNTSNVEFEILD